MPRRNQPSMSIDLQVAEAELIRLRRESNQADVRMTETGSEYYHVPIFYHCSPIDITHGWKAFYVGDTVLVADVDSVSNRRVIGFADGRPRRCEEGRFFAKIKTVRGIEYYWLFFTGSRVFAQKVDSKWILDLDDASHYPEYMHYLGSKAFELLDSENISIRYVGATHLLVKDRKIIFQPVVWPGKDLYFPEKTPRYKLPEFCLGVGYGYRHPCPPNRFYVNVSEKIMTWYAPGWGIEPFSLLEHTFLNGVTLHIPSIEDFDPENIASATVQSYLVDSYDSEDSGIEGFWFYKPVIEMIHLEVGEYSVWDVDELHVDKISMYAFAYNNQLLSAEKVFGGDLTFKLATKTYHRQWTREGFEQVLFASAYQRVLDDPQYYLFENFISGQAHDCNQYTTPGTCHDGCPGASNTGHCTEPVWAYVKSEQWLEPDKWSLFKTRFLGKTYWIECHQREGQIKEFKTVARGTCHWSYEEGRCWYAPPAPFPYGSMPTTREWIEVVKQRFGNGVSANFLLPNVVWTPYVISRRYIDADAEQKGDHWPECETAEATTGDFLLFCSSIWDAYGVTPLACFLKQYPMPGDDWVLITKDYIQPYTGGPRWIREGKQDYYLEKAKDIIEADDLGLSALTCSRFYYLDDRSTFEGQGLIIASKGEYWNPVLEQKIPNAWKIYWAPQGQGAKQDVTAAVLAALDCEISELLELGLV